MRWWASFSTKTPERDRNRDHLHFARPMHLTWDLMEFSILIVDDDANLLSVLKTLFAESHDVTTCSDGSEAVEICKRRHFDVILSDIIMPGASGLEVLKQARKSDPNTIVILITGFASLETAIDAIREGAYDYITKPFKLEQLKNVVKNALESVQLTRENQRLLEELQEAYQQISLIKGIMGIEERFPGTLNDDTSTERERKTLIGSDVIPYHLLQNESRKVIGFIENLERVGELRNRGLISEKEFELCKLRLFDNMK
jgi:CheY-like chemotaxis protein